MEKIPNSRKRGGRRNWSAELALSLLQKVFRHLCQRLKPHWMFIEAGDLRELFAARLQECVATAHADFLDGLETIGHKCRADHEQLFHAFFGKTLQLEVGIGFEPRVPAQARLKGDGV